MMLASVAVKAVSTGWIKDRSQDKTNEIEWWIGCQVKGKAVKDDPTYLAQATGKVELTLQRKEGLGEGKVVCCWEKQGN